MVAEIVEMYRDTVAVEVLGRPGGGCRIRIKKTDGKDRWNGSSIVLDLPPADRDALIADLEGTS